MVPRKATEAAGLTKKSMSRIEKRLTREVGFGIKDFVIDKMRHT